MSKPFDPLSIVKPRITAMQAYALPALSAPIKVNQNENPHELPPDFKAAVLRRVEAMPWSRYPPFVPVELHAALADHAHWLPEGVLAGNGSNELIQVLLACTIEPGRKVVICEPTFTLYRKLVTVMGGETISVPLREGSFAFDKDAILRAAIENAASLILLCGPNNPTGTAPSQADLRYLLDHFDGLLVLDEAYREFADGDAVALLRDHRNLVLLRTFSKAWGMAALRVGFLLGDPALIEQLDKGKLPYNLNRFSSCAVQVAIERYEELVAPMITQIRRDRDALHEGLLALPGYAPVPSRANFVLVRGPLPPAQIFSGLMRAGILARDVSHYPMLERCFRISVGTEDENAAVLRALGVIGEAAGGEP